MIRRRVAVPLVALALLAAAVVLPRPAGASVRFAERDAAVSTARSLAAGLRVLSPTTAPFRFDLVGVRWRGRGQVWFRVGLSGSWGTWQSARPEAEDLPDVDSTEARRRKGWTIGNPFWTGPANRIQLRVSGGVTRVRTGFVWSGIRRAPRLPAVAGTPSIISRAAWGADESIVRAEPLYAPRVAFVVVHHTAGREPRNRAESAAIVRAIEAYHVKANGWNDIGYNFLVDPFGQVFEGRGGGVDQNVVGAHAQGFNTGSAGIAVIGTYSDDAVSSEAEDALERLIAWRLDLAHVDPLSQVDWLSSGNERYRAGAHVLLEAVSGHRDTGPTTCPGDALYAELPEIAAAASQIGLPKLYDPLAAEEVGGQVLFTARLSDPVPWTVVVTDPAGRDVAQGTGLGPTVSWTWDALGVPNATYAYRIEAGAAVLPAVGTIGAGTARSAPTFEIADLHAAPEVFSPNGDGVDDDAAVSFHLTTPATVTATVLDAAGNPVVGLASGADLAAGATSLPWAGLDVDGVPLPDGAYRVEVIAQAGSKTVTRYAPLTLDRTLGALSLARPLFSPNGDGRLDTLDLGFDLTRPATVRVRVLAGDRSVARIFSGALQPGHQVFSWDGHKSRGIVRDGPYTLSVEATTDLGMRTQTQEFAADSTPPRVVVESVTPKRHSTKVTFSLSEPAKLKLWLGPHAFAAERPAGKEAFWQRVRASRVRIAAWDAAGNASAATGRRLAGRCRGDTCVAREGMP
jgi:flagellar hook assembly protein FlgD